MAGRKYRISFLDKSPHATRDKVHGTIRSLPVLYRLIFWLLFWIFIISLISILFRVNNTFIREVPRKGGDLSEGMVGRPAFINPVLAFSDSDKALSALIYSGLVRHTPSGSLEYDLASDIFISEDGTEYIITLKDDLLWHDGETIDADDVIFTIDKIQDPLIKSPLRSSWDGVVVDKIDKLTVRFTLGQPYSLFTRNLVVGILPEHIWNSFSVEDFINNTKNTNPIGTGPFKISNIKRSRDGVVQFYDLTSFDKFTLGEPFIQNIRLYFYSDKKTLIKAFENGEVDMVAGISSLRVLNIEEEDINIIEFPLARIFAVFLNQNEAGIFTEKEVRIALEISADKSRIVKEVLSGYGEVINSPLPNGIVGNDVDTRPFDNLAAKELLSKNGWVLNENGILEKKSGDKSVPLTFKLATSNIPELNAVAEILKESWRDIGINIDIELYASGDLNQEIIRPRNYEALLFGEVIGTDPDLFAFWHSSQRLDPGLNIALYANITADKRLEEARKTITQTERLSKYEEFLIEIENDIPAIFLYSPKYLLATPNHLRGVQAFPVTSSSERYSNIHKWHKLIDKKWSLFVKD